MTAINTWLASSWNAWREPVELPDHQAPAASPPPLAPPPQSFGPAVVFGQSAASNSLPGYGPSSRPASEPFDVVEAVDRIIASLERPGRISTLDPAFWVPLSDIWPAGSRQLAFHEVASLDHQAWSVSLARDLGISFERYSQEIGAERLRQVEMNSQESDWSGGSYSFTLDPSPRVSAPAISKTMLEILLEMDRGRPQYLFDGQPVPVGSAGSTPVAFDAAHSRGVLNSLGYELREVRPSSVTGSVLPDGTILGQGTRARYELVPRAGLSGPFTASNQFTEIGSPPLPFGGIFMSEDDKLIAQSERVVLGTFSSDEELLAGASRAARAAAARLGLLGEQTGKEYGLVLMKEGNRLVGYYIDGNANSVPVSRLADALLAKDDTRQLLWLVHNHPVNATASENDLRNGIAFRTRFPDTFQGIVIGKPGGAFEVWPSPDLPDW